MTIEEARNLIAEAEADISNVLTRVYDEIGIMPSRIEFQLEDVTRYEDKKAWALVDVKLKGMEL